MIRDYQKLLKKCPMFSRLLTLFLKSHHRTPSAQLATKQSCQITIFCQKSNFQKTPKYYDDIYYVSQNKVSKQKNTYFHCFCISNFTKLKIGLKRNCAFIFQCLHLTDTFNVQAFLRSIHYTHCFCLHSGTASISASFSL